MQDYMARGPPRLSVSTRAHSHVPAHLPAHPPTPSLASTHPRHRSCLAANCDASGCDSSGACIRCATGHGRASITDRTCVAAAAIPGCLAVNTNDATRCVNCGEGYALASDGRCYQCATANCASCSNRYGPTATCSQCLSGHGLVADPATGAMICLPCQNEGERRWVHGRLGG